MINWAGALQPVERIGSIEQSIGLKLVANGPPQTFVGEICEILDNHHHPVMQAEVIGFQNGRVFLMPFSKAHISMGYKIRATGHPVVIPVGNELPGNVIDALGHPLNTRSHFRNSNHIPLHSKAINPLHRKPIHERLHTGIHAIDTLFPIGKGQRIGLFAGSGVGKSVLLGMMAKHMTSDINVVALIGERGREVNDFIHQLDPETRRKSIIVVACSDEFTLMRKQAIYTATAIAEYFSQQGKDVMLFVDSITRFAMAQREIGLSLGEPPTSRGYTPSVFTSLPGLIERAGNFNNAGSITALYTVLVEGDDFNEPIADTMRSLLDGHIILTRELAQRGHYPAIDSLQSISRLAHHITTPEERSIMQQIQSILSLYHQNKDLIQLGAYKAGNHKALDHAMKHIDNIQALLKQNIDESIHVNDLFQQFKGLLQ